MNQELTQTENASNTKKGESLQTLTGYLGKEPRFKTLENDRAVISFSIKNANNEWVNAVAWNNNAVRIHEGIEKEGVKKLQVIGEMKDGKPYELEGKMMEGKQEFVVSDIKYLAKSIEMHGVIGSVQEKVGEGDKVHTRLFVLNNVSDTQVDKFNVMIFADTKKTIPKEVELEKGKPVAVKGEMRIELYEDSVSKTKKESSTVIAKYVERSPTKLRELVDKTKAPGASLNM